ncbi:major facilitator superfamily transporter [Seiridium cupressi]
MTVPRGSSHAPQDMMVDDPMAPETAAAKFSRPRKYVILFIVSWMTLAATWSASSIFIATPEISVEFHTTSDILTVLNAGVLTCMGISPLLWSPIGLLCGRTALAPNLGVFTTMRLLGGTTGTYFLVAGQTILADIFEPETRSKSLKGIALIFDPRGVFAQLLVPRILLAWPLLHRTRGWFFTGSIVGGRLSDRTVRHYIVKRDGVRIPEDRLHSGLVGLFGVLPAAALIFGWTLEKEVGGLAVPIISAFWIGIGLMGTFNSLNTYAAEASPGRRSEVLSAKYVIQWAFGAASTAAVMPFIDATGPGLVFTVSPTLLTPYDLMLYKKGKRIKRFN